MVTVTQTIVKEEKSASRELDHRESDGIAVTLVWYEDSDRVAVRVSDAEADEDVELDVDPRDALDAFRHPYAYLLTAA
jgi:hypothetical protein